MTKILKFNNVILNLDNLEVIKKDEKYAENSYYYNLYFTTCKVKVALTEEEFQYLTEFLKNDFKFYEINKNIYNIIDNLNSINDNLNIISARI